MTPVKVKQMVFMFKTNPKPNIQFENMDFKQGDILYLLDKNLSWLEATQKHSCLCVDGYLYSIFQESKTNEKCYFWMPDKNDFDTFFEEV